MHSGRVTNRMRRDVPISQTWAFDGGLPDGALQEVISSFARERCPTNAWESDCLRGLFQLSKPRLQRACGLRPQWHSSFLASFTVQLQKGACTKPHLIALEAGDFGDARSTVVKRRQQGVITASLSSQQIRRFEQRFHLFASEGLDDSLLGTLDRDGQNTSCEIDLFRLAQRYPTEECSDGCESEVARSHTVAPLLFQVVKKRQDNLCIHVRNAEGRGFTAGLLFDVLKQQTEGVPIAGDCLRAHPFVKLEMLSKEGLNQRSDERAVGCRHCSPPISAYCWNLSPATLNNSGVAVRYQ